MKYNISDISSYILHGLVFIEREHLLLYIFIYYVNFGRIRSCGQSGQSNGGKRMLYLYDLSALCGWRTTVHKTPGDSIDLLIGE